MGRAKLNMELIPKKKSRHTTFKKRKEGLIKKMTEFTTLCDVKACMIIYGPKQDEAGFAEPETWPPGAEDVGRVIDIYKSKKKDSNNKTSGLSDFFQDRQRKVEDELYKLRKKIQELKYPTRPDCMNAMKEARLREFAAALADKAHLVRSRIELMRRNHRESSSSAGLRGITESGLINNFNTLPAAAVYHHQQQQLQGGYPAIDHHQNSMMMLLMKDQVQFGPGTGPGSGGGNLLQYERQVYYEGGGVDPMMRCSPMPLARFYGPPVPYVQMVPPQPAGAFAYMPLPETHGGGGDGQEDEYGMMTTNHQMHKRGAYD